MLKSFIEKRKAEKAIKAFWASQVGRLLLSHNENFIPNSILVSYPEDQKEAFKAALLQNFFDVINNENPLECLRKLFADYVLNWAMFQIMCLTEADKSGASFGNSTYISGQLYKNIRELTSIEDALGKFAWENPDLTDEDLLLFCNAQAAINVYFINGLNILRLELNDMSENKDWLHPFQESALIFEEYQLRKKLNLAQLVPSDAEAIKHSLFAKYVVEAESPYYEWMKAFSN